MVVSVARGNGDAKGCGKEGGIRADLVTTATIRSRAADSLGGGRTSADSASGARLEVLGAEIEAGATGFAVDRITAGVKSEAPRIWKHNRGDCDSASRNTLGNADREGLKGGLCAKFACRAVAAGEAQGEGGSETDARMVWGARGAEVVGRLTETGLSAVGCGGGGAIVKSEAGRIAGGRGSGGENAEGADGGLGGAEETEVVGGLGAGFGVLTLGGGCADARGGGETETGRGGSGAGDIEIGATDATRAAWVGCGGGAAVIREAGAN